MTFIGKALKTLLFGTVLTVYSQQAYAQDAATKDSLYFDQFCNKYKSRLSDYHEENLLTGDRKVEFLEGIPNEDTSRVDFIRHIYNFNKNGVQVYEKIEPTGGYALDIPFGDTGMPDSDVRDTAPRKPEDKPTQAKSFDLK